MKKHAFLTLLISCFTTQVYAQEEVITLQKRVLCTKPQILLQALAKEEYKEQVQWTGADSDDTSMYVLAINKKTGTWTFIQMDKNIGCVLGSGVASKLIESDV